MVFQLLFMSFVLGVTTFAVGMIPLSYTFSRSHLDRLSALGTGLLLGAALGVIIPEGLEAIAEANPKELPTSRISLSLVVGFVAMLIIEQLISPDSHSVDISANERSGENALSVEFDAELGTLDQSTNRNSENLKTVSTSNPGHGRAFSLLMGLVIHASADGLALGVANLANAENNTVSFVVFLALIIHKAPTSLAFTTSILSTNLPRADCKKYLYIFSSSTPLSALASYAIFSVFREADKDNVIGIALLISGGTFLYVATVLQPVSHHSPAPGDMRPITRALFITIGIFIPVLLSIVLGHGH